MPAPISPTPLPPVPPAKSPNGKPVAAAKPVPPPKPDPKLEAARVAAEAQQIARAKAGQLKLAEWRQFLVPLSEADVYKDLGPPQVYGTNYWNYSQLVAGEQPNAAKADLEIFFDQGKPTGCVVAPARKPLTETWTYTWHQ